LALLAAPAWGALHIRITHGVRTATPIAVVPFAWQAGGRPPFPVATVIAHDLVRTGLFRTLSSRDLVQRPSRPAQINFLNWKVLGMSYLVIGRVVPGHRPGGWRLVFHLYNVPAAHQVLAFAIPTNRQRLRLSAHDASDLIFEKLTGQLAPFTSRIAYVESHRQGARRSYALMIADYGGHHPQAVVRSVQPIVSPAFSPHGNRIAYVSFENGFPAIYVQNLANGHRRRVLDRPGLDETPVFTPGGTHLLVTVTSAGGSSAIGRLNLRTLGFRILTHASGINTEPADFPGGGRLAFTSDREGSVQIYVKTLPSGRTRRLTFHGHYNAAPAVSPTGRELAFVARGQGLLRIARMTLKNHAVRLLTPGPLDDTPCFAPGGSIILFSARQGNHRVLETVSTHGDVIRPIRIPLAAGESVTTPTWGPDLPGSPHLSPPGEELP
jgi:TolB protein